MDGRKLIVLYDQQHEESNELCHAIYKEFCYDSENYLFKENFLYEIHFYHSLEDFEVSLINDVYDFKKDIFIFLNSGRFNLMFNEYDENSMLIEQIKKFVCPLIFNFKSNVFNILRTINQCKLLKNERDKFNILIAIMSRILLGNNLKKVFISYFRDEAKNIQKCFTKVINIIPSLYSFVDYKCIPYGSEFQNNLEENLNDSIVICVSTDNYSTRYWCLRELLYVKSKNIPMVVADCVSDIEFRRNPNMGNVPSIRIDLNNIVSLQKCIFYGLRELKKKEIFSNLIQEEGTLSLWRKPELNDLLSNEQICYPNPPLILAEKNYYNEFFDNRSLFTPYDKNRNSSINSIMLSISQEVIDNKFYNTYFLDLFIELCRIVIVKGININYGGDWRKEGFTQKIAEIIDAYRNYAEIKQNKIFNNYYALKENEIPNKVVETVDLSSVNFIYKFNYDENTKFPYTKKLSAMRSEMIKNSNGLIALGGAIISENSKCSGVAEEIYLAIQSKIPVYIIGGFGGATGLLADKLLENKPVQFKSNEKFNGFFDDYLKEINIFFNSDFTISSLENALSNDDNIKLLSSTSIEEIISLIIKGIDSNKQI